MSGFDATTLTRGRVIATALADPIFRAFLDQLKAADGFGPNSITIKDDHTNEETFDEEDVVLVVSFDGDGSPTKAWTGATAQDGHTHLPVWITPAYIRKENEVWTWGIRNKNPLYVHGDNSVHITRMSTGMMIWDASTDQTFDTVVHKQRGVYVTGWGGNKPQQEAHVWLTVAELAAL